MNLDQALEIASETDVGMALTVDAAVGLLTPDIEPGLKRLREFAAPASDPA